MTFFLAFLSFPLLILLPFVSAVQDFKRYRAWLDQRGLVGGGRFKAKKKWPTFLGSENLKNKYQAWISNWEFGEIFYLVFCPILALLFLHLYPNLQQIFATDYIPSLELFFVIPALCYWVSRKHKQVLPLWFNLLLPYGIALGIILAGAMSLHFISVVTFREGFLHPYLIFPLYAPIPAMLYGIRQFEQQNRYLEDRVAEQARQGNLSTEDYDAIHTLQWKNPAQNIALLFLMMVSLQVLLLPAGQPMNALLLAFTESSHFLFSMEFNAFTHFFLH